jgi:hypothetical protein
VDQTDTPSEVPSGVFFGLRTGVELFADPASAAAVTRAKEAALLYDRVIFEEGLLDVTVGEGGGSTWWTPPHQITQDMRDRARQPTKAGTPFTLSFGKQPAEGVPAAPEDMVTMISTTATHAYMAEYHSGILDETEPLELDWIEVVPTGGGSPPSDHPLGKQISRLDFADFCDKELLADRHSFEKNLIYKSFNRDSVLASALGAAITITPLFEPMVDRRGLSIDLPGDTALGILVPNLSNLPWEGVAEFREHPGCQEARAKLREFERRAAAAEPAEAAEFLRSVAQEVSRAYMQAVEDGRTRLGTELAEEAIKTGVSMVPGVGPLVEKAATTVQVARQAGAERRSWTSAIFKLLQRT